MARHHIVMLDYESISVLGVLNFDPKDQRNPLFGLRRSRITTPSDALAVEDDIEVNTAIAG